MESFLRHERRASKCPLKSKNNTCPVCVICLTFFILPLSSLEVQIIEQISHSDLPMIQHR